MAKINDTKLLPVVNERELQGTKQENVTLLDGSTVTKAKARQLYETAKRSLVGYMDVFLIDKALKAAQVDLTWELSRLKAIADQDKDLKSALQAMGMLRLIREAAIQGAGSGGARMTAKESKSYIDIHANEVIQIVGELRGSLEQGEKNQFDRKVIDAEIKESSNV